MGQVRIGLGFDAHPLVPGRPLVLGGIHIPYEKGLAGHSDGDVLLHSLVDALLGALALGDLGTHFPPTDPRYAGVSSTLLLARALEMVRARGWRVVNLDATILAERPRLAPYIPPMRDALARGLEVPEERVSIKAKTTNGLGFIGRGEGIWAHTVVLLEEAR